MGGRIIPFISDSTFTKQVRVWKLVGIWGLLPFLSTTQLPYTSTHNYIHHSISPYGVQVGNHCPFLPPYILRGICDDLFCTAADMVGGWAPLIMVWVVNLSSNILRSHSPPYSFVQYRHISPYHPISYIFQFSLASCPLSRLVRWSINDFHDNIRNWHR